MNIYGFYKDINSKTICREYIFYVILGGRKNVACGPFFSNSSYRKCELKNRNDDVSVMCESSSLQEINSQYLIAFDLFR